MQRVARRLDTSPWARRLLAPLVIAELLLGVGVIVLHATDSTEPFATDDALAEFHALATADDTTTTTALGAVTPAAAATAPDVTTVPPAASVTPTSAPSTTTTPPTTAGDAPTEVPSPGAAPATTAPTPPFPSEGVYVYDTVGFESTDALGGSRHTYPDQTSSTLVQGGCGYTEQWQPLHERYDRRSVCGAPGVHLASRYVQYHEFYGQSDTRDLQCEDGAVIFDPSWAAGDTASFRCRDERTSTESTFRVLGREAIDIGGVTVQAIHAWAGSEATGEASAHSEFETWLHPETGLTLKRVSLVDGTSPGPGGDFAYHEEYTITLRSLVPLQ